MRGAREPPAVRVPPSGGSLNAKMVIAQVNDQMPRTMGESFLHVSQLTCCVEASTPLPELGGGTIGEVEEAIGRNVASLVEDGSWIYIGAQGIVQGTYETFAEAGRQHYNGDLRGKWILTAGLGGMGGAQPLAGVLALRL